MTRPANPSYVIPIHAPDTNYPAGSDNWSGTPTKQTHPGSASVGLTPSTGVPAQVLNRLFFDAYKADGDAKDFITSLLAWTGQMAAQNLQTVAVTSPELARYKNGIWYFASSNTNDVFVRSSYFADIPAFAATEITGGNTTSQKCADFDVDDSGRIVAIDDGAASYKHYNGSSWAKVTTGFHNTAKGCIVWEAVSGRWCAVGPNTATSNPQIVTSTNRTTWFAATLPTGLPGTVAGISVGSNGTGRIVAAFFTSTGVRFSKSDDGGQTWSAATSEFTTTFTPAASAGDHWPKPIWNGSYWLLGASSAAGSGSDGKVYKSTDGITWSLVATHANDGVRYMACLGNLWMGLVDNLRLAMSVDGASWKVLPLKVSNCATIHAGGGRFLLVGSASGDLHYTLAMGDGSDLLGAT